MLSHRIHPLFALNVILTDIVCIFLGFTAAYYLRFSGLFPIHRGIPSFPNYMNAVMILIPIYILIFRSYRLYQPERLYRRIYELLTVVKAISIAAIVAMSLTFVYREFSYSRVVLLFA